MTREAGNLVVVGRIVGAHGVKGWVKLLSFTDPPANLFDYQPWQLEGEAGWQTCSVAQGRSQGKSLVAKFADVNDREAALALRGTDIAVSRDAFPQTADEEYYWTDLIGLKVVTTNNVAIGVITQMMETGANDVMVVEDEQRQRLVPFVMHQVVKTVNLNDRTVTVDWDPDF